MNVSCPGCETTYRVDPAKVPAGGVRARCSQCRELIPIESPAAAAGGAGSVLEEPGDFAALTSGGDETTRAESRVGESVESARAAGAAPPAAPREEAASEPAVGPSVGSSSRMSELGAEEASPSDEFKDEAPSPRSTGPRPAPAFGATDPDAKARRLARALVSDIVVYHPERRQRSIAAGTLRKEFREEIQKSWEEYVSQVGDSLARGTPHFREALNEILAGGTRVF